MFAWIVGRTVVEPLPGRPGKVCRRPPHCRLSGYAARSSFISPGTHSDVWVCAAEVSEQEASVLIAQGCVLFTNLRVAVPMAAREKLEALGLDAALVQRAGTVRELLREAAKAPDDSFDRLEARAIERRARMV